jgi:hypothetical protein
MLARSQHCSWKVLTMGFPYFRASLANVIVKKRCLDYGMETSEMLQS